MKYPFIIFYRKEKYKCIDNFFTENSLKLNCSFFLAKSIDFVKNMHNSNYHLLFTYGDNDEELQYKEELLTILSNKMLIRHTHILTNTDIFDSVTKFNELVNDIYVLLCSLDREHTRPTFSLFTTCYNSYNKIFRVYNSLQSQTLKDWEWVIIDDSPNDEHFKFLREHFQKDSREIGRAHV